MGKALACISLLFSGELEQAQTLLLKHGIDASHLYLCQIYQNISDLFGLVRLLVGRAG